MSNSNSTTYSIPGTLTIGAMPALGIPGTKHQVTISQRADGVTTLWNSTNNDVTFLLYVKAIRVLDLAAPRTWTLEHEALVAALETKCTLTNASLEGR